MNSIFSKSKFVQYLIFYKLKIEMEPQSNAEQNKIYKTINCCSQGASISQTLAIGLFVGIEILSFNLIASMLAQCSSAMYVLMAMSYTALFFLIVEYIRLLVIDPSDPRLQDSNYRAEGITVKQCEICQCRVAESSYHCHSCNRCVEDFDHHCTFANNCIGSKNYSIFIRLLIAIILHTGANMGISVWLALTLTDSYKWLAVAFGSLSFIVFAEITVLALFHCYISFCLFKTTLQVLKGDEPRPVSIKIIKDQGNNGQHTNIDLVKVNNNFGQS